MPTSSQFYLHFKQDVWVRRVTSDATEKLMKGIDKKEWENAFESSGILLRSPVALERCERSLSKCLRVCECY